MIKMNDSFTMTYKFKSEKAAHKAILFLDDYYDGDPPAYSVQYDEKSKDQTVFVFMKDDEEEKVLNELFKDLIRA